MNVPEGEGGSSSVHGRVQQVEGRGSVSGKEEREGVYVELLEQ